ncbi:MAG: hypothetical protein HY698_13235 [Deltaproteobacteria bacterium]|nr:hypothetical protein [Deltaproteobacteria bacterium]
MMSASKMARLFISQDRLDSWSSEDRVRVEGDLMTLSGDGRSFKLKPAVRFIKVSDDSPDPHGLIGKVRTIEVLVKSGGEHYMDSVIFQETAYDVQQGFLGEPTRREPLSARTEG